MTPVTPSTSSTPTVLFVCVHNAGRSQMAAAFTQAFGGDRVTVLSAGSEPAAALNPTVVIAMAEVGIDLTSATPRRLTDTAVLASDAVITMGCGDACPIYPGKRYLDWEITDPAGQPVDVVRAIRDEIQARVLDLLTDLGIDPQTAGPTSETRPA